MNRTALLWMILLLSFIGVADTWYLAYSAFTDTALSCGVNVIDGCNTVAKSEYSWFLGLPLGLYGVAFYVLTFVLSAVLLVLPRPILFRLLLALTSVAVIFSLYFLGLQVLIINALCVYCIISIALSILIFVLSLRCALLPTTRIL